MVRVRVRDKVRVTVRVRARVRVSDRLKVGSRVQMHKQLRDGLAHSMITDMVGIGVYWMADGFRSTRVKVKIAVMVGARVMSHDDLHVTTLYKRQHHL